MENVAVDLLEQRGVTVDDMAELVLRLQLQYNASLTVDVCRDSVIAVLAKREVQHAVITGITLDTMAERGALDEPLGKIVRRDDPLFGMDEVLGLAIINVYGSIGLSNYGFLALERPGVLARLGERDGVVCTFLDDIVAAIVAATCARLAHQGEGAVALS